MSKLFARLAGGGKKKDARPTPPVSPAPAPTAVKVPSYSSSNDIKNSPISPRPPRIDLDFRTTSSPVGNTSPAPHSAVSTPATSSRNARVGGDRETEVMEEDEAKRLSEERFDWKQVEHAWSLAGRQLLAVGLETPHLFERNYPTTPETEEQINRLLSLLMISTSPEPLSILPSLPSLTDFYPAPEFIPRTPGWFDNDFTTNVQAVKDPRILVGLLRRVTSQVAVVSAVDDKEAEVAGRQEKQERGSQYIALPQWYTTFIISDKTSSHPTDVYTTLLAPLISKQHHIALSTIFDTWLHIDTSSRFNSTSARFLADITAWWIMACWPRLLSYAKISGEGVIGWQMFYDAWVEAGEAVYRLFLSWIRNQPTSTLPLRAMELVQSYPALPSDTDINPETDVLLLNLAYTLPATAHKKTTHEDVIPVSSREMVAVLLEAVGSGTGRGKTEGVDDEEVGSWRHPAAIGSPDSGRDGTTTLRQIIQAIKDAQHLSSASSSSRNVNGIHTPPAKGSADDGPLYRPFRTPSSSSFMQGIDTPDRSPSVNGGTPHSTRNASALGFPPESPHSVSHATPTGGITEPDASWMDFAQSGFDGGSSNLREKPFVLGEAFKEAPQVSKSHVPLRKPESHTAATLGIGRPGQAATRKPTPKGTYTFKSVGVTRLRPSFFEFEKDASRIPHATEGWPAFMVLTLDDRVVQQFDLRSRHLLVLVDTTESEKPEIPPTPVEKDQDSRVRSVSAPLQTPPLPPNIVQIGYTSPTADDSDKRNRRRSFFRSFSGGSNKNRRSISSPLSSPSLPNSRMSESPLPRVIEKREPPLPSPKPSQSPLPTVATAVPLPSQNLLEPYRPIHSRSTSSVHRKPAPVLDQDELRELERSESRTRTSTDMRDGDNKGGITIPHPLVVEDNVEVIRTDSIGSSSSTRNDSDSPRSLPRRRRSMAPSPASVGDVQAGEDGVPVIALNKLALDDEIEEKSSANVDDDMATGGPSSIGQALDVEPDASNDEIQEKGVLEQAIGKDNVGSATLNAPVILGAIL